MNRLILSEISDRIILDEYDRSIIHSDLDILHERRYIINFRNQRDFEVNQYQNLFKFRYPGYIIAEKSLDNCSICLENIEKGDKIYKLHCSHIFHSSCLEQWNKNTCPYCRSEIT